MAERTCPRCTMTESDWEGNHGTGVEVDGSTYCCRGCARDGDCTCGESGE